MHAPESSERPPRQRTTCLRQTCCIWSNGPFHTDAGLCRQLCGGGFAPHSSCGAFRPEPCISCMPTCQEGLQGLQQLCAGTAAALGLMLLELGGQQQAPPAAGVAEDLPTQAAVVPSPPEGPAGRVLTVRQCMILQRARLWDGRQWAKSTWLKHPRLPPFTRPGQTHKTSTNMTGKTGILLPAETSATVCHRELQRSVR